MLKKVYIFLQVMMIQEQVAMFLNVKSFKRRYPELKRRTITGEERDYVLSKGLVTEALCDLGMEIFFFICILYWLLHIALPAQHILR